jgi:uncharacterized protein
MLLAPKSTSRCPICRHVSAAAHAPFCSARCRDRDLLNWLGEAYAVPAEAVDETALDKE